MWPEDVRAGHGSPCSSHSSFAARRCQLQFEGGLRGSGLRVWGGFEFRASMCRASSLGLGGV